MDKKVILLACALSITLFIFLSPFVRSSEGDYYGVFNLTANNPYPSGITQNNTFFWISDSIFTEVYIYWMNGTYTGNHWDTAGSGNGNPRGITQDGTYIYIGDSADAKIYRYWMNGTYIDNVAVVSTFRDILTNGTFMFVTDSNSDKVRKYLLNGTSVDYFSFNDHSAPEISGIATDNYRFWITDYSYNAVYIYWMNGTYTGSYWNVTAEDTTPAYISNNGTYLFILDTDTKQVFIYYGYPDTIAPYFTKIPDNASIFYGNQSLGVDFDANDNVFFSSYAVNDSRFIINTSGWLSNSTILGVGNYELNITINDTSGNINWTIYNVKVNKSLNDNCKVLFNETSPLEYTQTFTVWTNCSTAFVLMRNGTIIINNSEQDLAVGAYNFSFLRNDTQNYTFIYNESQFIITDTTSPVLNILSPTDGESFTVSTIDLNFSAVDPGVGLDKCWYQNGTGNNITVSCTDNTTISHASDGTYVIYMWANDSYGNTATDHKTWTISANAPAINLKNPLANKYLDYVNNILLNFTATDSNGIDTCELWGNWTGSWVKNQTLTTIVSGSETNFSVITLPDGVYIWNVWCNDTTGLPNTDSWATLNRTFTVDTTHPQIVFLTANGSSYTSLSVTINFTVNEINKDTCTFVLRNGTGDVHNYVANTSLDCSLSSIAVSTLDYGSFTFQLWATDKAGNVNQSIFSFSSSAPVIPPTTTGGGGGNQEEEVEKIPVIGLIRPNNTAYSELDMEIFYAEINSKCSLIKENRELAIYDYSGDCSLTIQDLKDIATKLATEGVSIKEEDLIILFKQYNSKELFQGYETKETITKWKLFTSVLGIPNPIFINPPSWRGIVILTDLDNVNPKQVSKIFIVNKNLAECNIIEDSGNNLTCDILTPTTFKVTYTLNDTNFFDKILDGEISVTTNATSENIEVRPVPVSVKVYNINYNIGGMPFWFIGGFTIFLIFGTFMVSFGPKKIRLIGKKRIKRRKG